MSITYKGVRNGELTKDKDGNISTSRIFVFYFNGGESPVKILQDSNMPKIGDVHPDNATLLVTSINISSPQEGDEVKSAKYEVTATYTRQQSSASVNKSTVKPWSRDPFNISSSPAEVIVPFQKGYDYSKDTNGNPSVPVLNSAGDPFEESTSRYNRILRFSYNLESFNDAWIDLYTDTVVNRTMTVIDTEIPEYHGRMKYLASSKNMEYDEDGNLLYEYYTVDVEIEISPVVWKKEIMHRGLFALKTGSDLSTKYRIYTDNAGHFGTAEDMKALDPDNAIPVDEPQRLNANGTLYTTDLTGAVYATFYDKFVTSWNELSLPETKIKKDSIFKYNYGVADL